MAEKEAKRALRESMNTDPELGPGAAGVSMVEGRVSDGAHQGAGRKRRAASSGQLESRKSRRIEGAQKTSSGIGDVGAVDDEQKHVPIMAAGPYSAADSDSENASNARADRGVEVEEQDQAKDGEDEHDDEDEDEDGMVLLQSQTEAYIQLEEVAIASRDDPSKLKKLPRSVREIMPHNLPPASVAREIQGRRTRKAKGGAHGSSSDAGGQASTGTSPAAEGKAPSKGSPSPVGHS